MGGFGDAEIKFWSEGPSSWASVLVFLISSCAAAHRVLCRREAFCSHRSLAGHTVELCGQKTSANSSVHTNFMCFLPRTLYPRKARWVGSEWQQGRWLNGNPWWWIPRAPFCSWHLPSVKGIKTHRNAVGRSVRFAKVELSPSAKAYGSEASTGVEKGFFTKVWG